VVEAGAVREEVVDLAGLHVVGEAGDEEREDALPVRLRVRRVHVVGVHRRRPRREAVGEAHLGAPPRRRAARLGSARPRFRCLNHCCASATATASSSTGPMNLSI
jgi:hypothetical protein